MDVRKNCLLSLFTNCYLRLFVKITAKYDKILIHHEPNTLLGNGEFLRTRDSLSTDRARLGIFHNGHGPSKVYDRCSEVQHQVHWYSVSFAVCRDVDRFLLLRSFVRFLREERNTQHQKCQENIHYYW